MPIRGGRCSRAPAPVSLRASCARNALTHALRAIGLGRDLSQAQVTFNGFAKRFVIRDAEGMYFVPVADVDRVEADGDYVAVIAGGRHHLVRQAMHVLESRLDPAEFVRVHRSHMVRIERIRRVEPCGHGEYELTRADGIRVTSSRSYREQVRRLLR